MSTRPRTPDWIALEGAVNARAVIPGVLLRSDNLQDLTGGDIGRLVDEHGLELVLDLRTDVEVALEGPGPITAEKRVRIEYRSLYPDSGGNTDLDIETVRPWSRFSHDTIEDEPPVIRAYVSYLHRRPDSIVGAIRSIARADGAALVHCAAGKDRTGVVVALALDAAGCERDQIFADYLASGDRIEAIMARLVSSSTYRAELEGHDPSQHAPLPGTMERFFEIVDERLGGAAGWLTANGLDEEDLQRLRRRLAPPRASGGAHPRGRRGDAGLEPDEFDAQLLDQRRSA